MAETPRYKWIILEFTLLFGPVIYKQIFYEWQVLWVEAMPLEEETYSIYEIPIAVYYGTNLEFIAFILTTLIFHVLLQLDREKHQEINIIVTIPNSYLKTKVNFPLWPNIKAFGSLSDDNG